MYVTHIECDLLSNLGGTADIMLRPFWDGAFLLWEVFCTFIIKYFVTKFPVGLFHFIHNVIVQKL